ncbi:MAG: hypothetical protein Q8K60_08915 [Parachlamydiaceae bacterium]|nr:hypothetical protein [Parachlamydiaceae bacterium]
MIAKLILVGTQKSVYNFDTKDRKPTFTDQSIENLMLERGLQVITGSTRKTVKLNDEGFHEAFISGGYKPYYNPDYFKWEIIKEADVETPK